MKTINETTGDMRALASLISSVADDLDALARLFGGGPAIATPFAPSQSEPRASPLPLKTPSHPVDTATKLLVRQLWFSRPQASRNINLTREISAKTGVDPRTVATIIRRTPQSDLSAFLQTQGQN